MKRLLLLGALAVVGAGCSSITEPARDENAPIQTDRLTYRLRAEGPGRGVTIPYVFHNRTGATVYVVNCANAFHLTLQRLEDGEWQDA